LTRSWRISNNFVDWRSLLDAEIDLRWIKLGLVSRDLYKNRHCCLMLCALQNDIHHTYN